MATNSSRKQEAVAELLELNGEYLATLTPDQTDLIDGIAIGLDEALASQGAFLHADEALTVLTVLETIDFSDQVSVDDVSLSVDVLRLAMMRRISEAWKTRDKDFFVR